MSIYFVFPALFLILGRTAPAQEAIREKQDTLNGRAVYIAWKDRNVTGKRPVLMALHGSGREADSYRPGSPKSVPFYIRQRDLALEAGYIFVAVSNGKDTWGTDEGVKAALGCYAYVKDLFHTEEKWVLWGSSAGGVLVNRLVAGYPGMIRKVIGTFPVYDLAESYARLSSAGKAWSSIEAVASVNPAGNPAALAAVPYLLFHGREDKAVPAGAHSVRLRDEVNGAGGNVTLLLVGGGHSTDNDSLYRDDVIRGFLRN